MQAPTIDSAPSVSGVFSVATTSARKAELKAYKADWYAKHKEELRIRSLKRYHEHRDEAVLAARERRRKRTEQMRALKALVIANGLQVPVPQ